MMILFLICVQVAYDKLATFVILICHGLHFLLTTCVQHVHVCQEYEYTCMTST